MQASQARFWKFHVFAAVSDFERSPGFYRALMATLEALPGSAITAVRGPAGKAPIEYGVHFRDTEGNKLCVACHLPEA